MGVIPVVKLSVVPAVMGIVVSVAVLASDVAGEMERIQ